MPATSKASTLSRPLWVLLLGLAAATLFSFLGRLHWFLELFTHFPLQLAIGLGVLATASVLLRRWNAAAVAALCLAPNLVALSYYFPSSDFSSEAPTLRILSYNVLTQNDSHGEVLAYLQNSDADILFLMETNPEWVEALDPLRAKYPHSIEVPRIDNFGMILFSRHPIVSQKIHQFADASIAVPLIHAVIDLDDTHLDVIGCHPVPPVSARMSSSRNTYLTAITQRTTETRNPTLVLGDFNATVWSPFLRDFLETTSLHDTGHKQGFQSSWRRLNPFFSLPIDHVFHSDGVLCTGREIGPSMGSDHRPVIADLFIRGGAL